MATFAESRAFMDRRSKPGTPPDGRERRQFRNNTDDLDPDAKELQEAVDEYKLEHHRRFITMAEVLGIIKRLGYHR